MGSLCQQKCPPPLKKRPLAHGLNEIDLENRKILRREKNRYGIQERDRHRSGWAKYIKLNNTGMKIEKITQLSKSEKQLNLRIEIGMEKQIARICLVCLQTISVTIRPIATRYKKKLFSKPNAK